MLSGGVERCRDEEDLELASIWEFIPDEVLQACMNCRDLSLSDDDMRAGNTCELLRRMRDAIANRACPVAGFNRCMNL